MLTLTHACPRRHEQTRPCWHSGGSSSMPSTPSPLTHLFCLPANNYASLLLFHPPLWFWLCRCERAEPMRLFPSMPLAQHHRVPVSSTGWILALALLLALQVKFFTTVLFELSLFPLFPFLATVIIDLRSWNYSFSFHFQP